VVETIERDTRTAIGVYVGDRVKWMLRTKVADLKKLGKRRERRRRNIYIYYNCRWNLCNNLVRLSANVSLIFPKSGLTNRTIFFLGLRRRRFNC